jgi:hypothetical protein
MEAHNDDHFFSLPHQANLTQAGFMKSPQHILEFNKETKVTPGQTPPRRLFYGGDKEEV